MNLSLIKISQKSKQFSFSDAALLHLSEDELIQFRSQLNEVVAQASSIYRLKKRKNTKVLCEVCNESVDKYYFDKHCTMSSHIKKLEEQGLSLPDLDTPYNTFCGVCNKDIKQSYWNRHILTASHIRKCELS